MSACNTSTVARASSSARCVGVVSAPSSAASADSFDRGRLVTPQDSARELHGAQHLELGPRQTLSGGCRLEEPDVEAGVVRDEYCTTGELEEGREHRVDPRRGAHIAVVIPVSSTMYGGIARPGSTRVPSSPSTSPPRTFTAPISVIASDSELPPVVSRSTTTKVVSRRGVSSSSKVSWRPSAVREFGDLLTTADLREPLRQRLR